MLQDAAGRLLRVLVDNSFHLSLNHSVVDSPITARSRLINGTTSRSLDTCELRLDVPVNLPERAEGGLLRDVRGFLKLPSHLRTDHIVSRVTIWIGIAWCIDEDDATATVRMFILEVNDVLWLRDQLVRNPCFAL